jgi:5'-phosphate synthase pdxT subunit
MMNIGVLALQGAFKEHSSMIQALGHNAIEIRSAQALKEIDGLILPGGESTAMGKLLDDFDMKDPLIQHIKSGLPTWGTCAGMILLAKELDNASQAHLKVMSIKVRRNAYGRQLDSFSTEKIVPKISETPIPLVFIRAPLVTEITDSVDVLLKVDEEIVAVKENHMLATSFHPELTNNTAFHEYFLEMVMDHKRKKPE